MRVAQVIGTVTLNRSPAQHARRSFEDGRAAVIG